MRTPLKRMLAFVAALFGSLCVGMYAFLAIVVGLEKLRDDSWLVPVGGVLLWLLAWAILIGPKDKKPPQ